MLRIGFETHGASRSPSTASSSPNPLPQHPLAHQPKPSQLSASSRRGADEESHSQSTTHPTSIINGVSLSSAIPSTRAQSPLPTPSVPTSTATTSSSSTLSVSSALPRSGSSSSLSTASSSLLSSSSTRPSSSALPSFLKGGSAVSASTKNDKTGKRRKAAVSESDDEEEFMKQTEKDNEEEEKRQEEKRQQKKTTAPPRKTTPLPTSSSTKGNRLNKLRGKAAQQAKLRNSRGGGGGNSGGRIVKDEEDAEGDEEAAEGGVGVHIRVVSPTLNDVEVDDDDAPPPPDSPAPFILSPRKGPAPQRRSQGLSSSPRSLSPMRSSTPDPVRRVKGGVTGRLSPLPLSPAHAGGSPSPSAFVSGVSCARLKPWTGGQKERVGDPCEKDQWKGSWSVTQEESEDSEDEEEEEEVQRPPPPSEEQMMDTDVAPVVPTPVPLVRRQSLRSFRRQTSAAAEEVATAPLAPTVEATAEAAPAVEAEAVVEEEAGLSGKKGGKRKGPAPAATKLVKGRKRAVLAESDDEDDGVKAEGGGTQPAAVEAKVEEVKSEEAQVKAEVKKEEKAVASVQEAKIKRGSVPPVDTTTPSPPTTTPPLLSPLLTPASRSRSKRKRAGEAVELPSVDSSPPALPSSAASPVVTTRSKKAKVGGEGEAVVAAVPASPPLMRRTRSSTSQPASPALVPSPAHGEEKEGRRGRRISKAPQEVVPPLPLTVAEEPSSASQSMEETEAASTAEMVALTSPDESRGAATMSDVPSEPSPVTAESTVPVPPSGGDEQQSRSSKTASQDKTAASVTAEVDGSRGGDRVTSSMSQSSRSSVSSDQERGRHVSGRSGGEGDNSSKSSGQSSRSPRDRSREQDRSGRDGNGRNDRDRGRERDRDREYGGRGAGAGGDGGGDRERKGSRDRERERDRGRDRDGDSRRGQREREREKDGSRSSREREVRERERDDRGEREDRSERNDRRVNTSRPSTQLSSPSGSRSPDSRGRYFSESARERDRKDRTRSFDETITRKGKDEPVDRGLRDSQTDRVRDREKRDSDREERRRREERTVDKSDKREAVSTAKEEEPYERRRKDSDHISGVNQISPVPNSPASTIPTVTSASPTSSTASSSSSAEVQSQAKARAYKHRADSMKSADSVELKREKAFLYTVAGILFFLAAHRKKPTPSTSSSSSSGPTSYKEFFDFLHSNQKVINDSALYSLSQVSHRAKALCALQHSLAYLDNAACKKTAKRLVGELKDHSQSKSSPPSSDFLTSSRCQELLQMAECVDLQCTAREQWKLAAGLNFVSERPFPSYGLNEDAVEKNSVKGVVEYCRRTLMDLVDRKEVVLSSPVDLDALDVEWKGDK